MTLVFSKNVWIMQNESNKVWTKKKWNSQISTESSIQSTQKASRQVMEMNGVKKYLDRSLKRPIRTPSFPSHRSSSNLWFLRVFDQLKAGSCFYEYDKKFWMYRFKLVMILLGFENFQKWRKMEFFNFLCIIRSSPFDTDFEVLFILTN
jgi:hypothetical protein